MHLCPPAGGATRIWRPLLAGMSVRLRRRWFIATLMSCDVSKAITPKLSGSNSEEEAAGGGGGGGGSGRWRHRGANVRVCVCVFEDPCLTGTHLLPSERTSTARAFTISCLLRECVWRKPSSSAFLRGSVSPDLIKTLKKRAKTAKRLKHRSHSSLSFQLRPLFPRTLGLKVNTHLKIYISKRCFLFSFKNHRSL